MKKQILHHETGTPSSLQFYSIQSSDPGNLDVNMEMESLWWSVIYPLDLEGSNSLPNHDLIHYCH